MADWQLKRDTQDPAKIYEQKESRTCKGCIHLGAVWSQPWCLKIDVPAKKKCSRYKESE